MDNEDLTMWHDDKLDHLKRAIAFTKIIRQSERARVISVEGGFGSGKTFFRKRWADHLRATGETVIEFDAWKSDHTGDPLLAFSFELLRSLQGPTKKKGVGSQLRDVATTVAKAGIYRGSQVLVGEAVDEIGDEFGQLLETVGLGTETEDDADNTVLSRVAKDGFKAMRKSMSQEVSKALLAQFEAERIREVELPEQLQKLRNVLKASGQGNGRVIVLIDELDRCRPDYAISLLEAIKHLFDQEGYVFVLFINPFQLASTAARLFGEIESGEPYFTKFIDLRLNLDLKSTAALLETFFLEILSTHYGVDEINEPHLDELLTTIQHIAKELMITPRQIEKAFTLIDVTLSTSDDFEKDDLSSVVVGSLYVTSNLSEKEIEERVNLKGNISQEFRKMLPDLKTPSKIIELLKDNINLIAGMT